MTELSDELLVAYVDGQLARDQSRAIKRVLDNDEVAAARVEALRATQRRLEVAFDAMLADELDALTSAPPEPKAFPAEPPVQFLRRTEPRRTWPMLAAGAAFALLAAGAWAPYFVPVGELLPVTDAPKPAPEPVVTAALPKVPEGPTGWLADMAAGHALLARDSLEVSAESQGNADLAYFQLTKAIDKALIIPDLTKEGLDFRRAQLLQSEGRPVAEIAYLPKAGAPLTLYARAGGGGDTPFTFERLQDTTLVSWDQNGISMLVVASKTEDAVKPIVAAVYDQMAAAARQPLPEPPAVQAAPSVSGEPAPEPSEAPAAASEGGTPEPSVAPPAAGEAPAARP